MARDGEHALAGLPDQCFAAFFAFLPLCLTLPASFLVLPFIDFAPCLAFLATPTADSSVLDKPVAVICHAGCCPNLADLVPASYARASCVAGDPVEDGGEPEPEGIVREVGRRAGGALGHGGGQAGEVLGVGQAH